MTMRRTSTASGRQPWLIAATCAVLLMATAVAGENPMPEGRQVTGDGRLIPLDSKTREIADLARGALATELSVDPVAIEVDTVKAMQWSDTSLGCPEPGFGYGQVITPGYRVTLRLDGVIHFVHTNTASRAVVCERKEMPGAIPRADGEVSWVPQATVARQDLSKRLSVPLAKIRVAHVRGKTWPDRSLDCPVPNVTYPPESVKGYMIRLRVGQRAYTYHTDLERTVPCPPIASD
ncbi:MAG: hypothetical protein AAGA68_16185 [Pseudomonadota bacterium]